MVVSEEELHMLATDISKHHPRFYEYSLQFLYNGLRRTYSRELSAVEFQRFIAILTGKLVPLDIIEKSMELY